MTKEGLTEKLTRKLVKNIPYIFIKRKEFQEDEKGPKGLKETAGLVCPRKNN